MKLTLCHLLPKPTLDVLGIEPARLAADFEIRTKSLLSARRTEHLNPGIEGQLDPLGKALRELAIPLAGIAPVDLDGS